MLSAWLAERQAKRQLQAQKEANALNLASSLGAQRYAYARQDAENARQMALAARGMSPLMRTVGTAILLNPDYALPVMPSFPTNEEIAAAAGPFK